MTIGRPIISENPPKLALMNAAINKIQVNVLVVEIDNFISYFNNFFLITLKNLIRWLRTPKKASKPVTLIKNVFHYRWPLLSLSKLNELDQSNELY